MFSEQNMASVSPFEIAALLCSVFSVILFMIALVSISGCVCGENVVYTVCHTHIFLFDRSTL